MKYPHDELIRAWLDGRTVQYRNGDHWRDIEAAATVDKMPHFYRDGAYRLKPEVFRVRHALMRTGVGTSVLTVHSLVEEKDVAASPHFARWLDDWTELHA